MEPVQTQWSFKEVFLENCLEGPQKKKKKKKELPVGPENATPGYTSWQNNKTKRYTHACVQSSIIHNSQDMKTWTTNTLNVHQQMNG